jgi:AraC family transcriptional regulator, positive regulator of tynA and feaB
VTDVAAGRLGDVLVELIGVAVSGERETIRQSETTTMLRARTLIRRQLGEADLSPAEVAKELRISVRTLHKLFEHSEQSFAECVRRERLERCAADLRNTCDKRTISEIAFRWGFSDSSHFSRVFKLTFGRSPRAFRHERKIADQRDI